MSHLFRLMQMYTNAPSNIIIFTKLDFNGAKKPTFHLKNNMLGALVSAS